MLLTAATLLTAASQLLAQEPASWIARLKSDSIDERRAAAEALMSIGGAGSDAFAAIARELAALGGTEPGRLTGLMRDLAPRVGRGADLVDLLVQQRPDTAVENALATVCLIRALARIGTTPAVRQIVLAASEAGGLFRPEISRQLKQLDDRATAGLIEARESASPDIRMWTKDVLESLGKRTAGDAVQTTNDQVLIDVLHAYAMSKDADALAVVLSFVNSDRAQVRAAAREATLAYGPDAAGRLRVTYAALTGERAPDGLEAAEIARRLFAGYDQYRLRDVYTQLDDGLAKQQAGDTIGAVGTFDNVLARQPLLDRRAEMAPAYVALGEWVEATDRMQALEYLHKALRLDAASAQSSHVRSEIVYLEGEDLISRGVVDVALYEQALALDPHNVHARTRLDGLRAGAQWRRAREGRIAIAAAVAGLALVMLGMHGLRTQRPRRAGAGPHDRH
jgi:tetratricopeptide (TPR) repeat protein